MPEKFHPHFMSTGMGSVPYRDPAQALEQVLGHLKEMPYWPQLPNRGPMEDMNLQYTGALAPLVTADKEARSLKAHPEMAREEALAAFYERLWNGPSSDFALEPEAAAGLFAYIDAVQNAGPGAYPRLKGQITGPFTLASSVMGRDGKALLYDDEAAEAIARGLGAAAAAQVDQLTPLGRPILIFTDEPALAGFGSAFTPVSREKVISLLGYTVEEARQRNDQTLLGIHCCGNTDWSMLIEAGFDVINLDSADYGQGFLLYPQAIRDLLDRGGVIAWGAVPTYQATGQETAQGLWQALKELLLELETKGFTREELARQSMITPACGMGTLSDAQARKILGLTVQVTELARKEFV